MTNTLLSSDKKIRHDLKNSFVTLNSHFKYIVNQDRDYKLTKDDIEEFEENISEAISAWNVFKEKINE